MRWILTGLSWAILVLSWATVAGAILIFWDSVVPGRQRPDTMEFLRRRTLKLARGLFALLVVAFITSAAGLDGISTRQRFAAVVIAGAIAAEAARWGAPKRPPEPPG